jgi:hypothetical protein
MENYKVKGFFVIMVMLVLVFLLSAVVTATILSLEPASQTVSPGQQVGINITVTDVLDLYALQTDVKFSSGLLQYSSITQGDFLKQGGVSLFEWPPDTTTPGLLKNYMLSRTAVPNGVGGSGVLATIKFNVGSSGIANIGILNNQLVNSSVDEISHTTSNATVTISSAPSCTDSDLDGYGVCPNCGISNGCTYDGDDCNDGNININPGATELCNGVDDNCVNGIDENNGDCSGNTPYCSGGVCVACTLDSHCDDGLFCTIDTCSSGSCSNSPRNVDDGVACTIDTCNEANQTIGHTPDHNSCQDGLWCNGQEVCNVTTNCQAGTAVICDDLIDCTIDSCDEGTNITDNIGVCDYNTDPCSCVINSDCDDSNPCTDDICKPDYTCDNIINNSNTCDDGFFCTVNDRCSSGNCIADPRPVNDGIACTEDSCDDILDIVKNVPNNTKCDDGNECTDNICNALQGCQYPNLPYGTPCSSGICIDGVCETVTCNITSIEWSRLLAIEGTNVTINMQGIGCDGMLMNVTILERDFFTDDDEVTSFSTNYTQILLYTAVFMPDEYGLPEFYVRVEIDKQIFESSKRERLLRVLPSKRRMRQKIIELKPGKNQFTMPLIADNMSIDYVFRDISNKADKIYTRDGQWKIHHFDGKPSNLDDLEPGRGYMLFMNEGANLTINGSKTYPNLDFPRFTLSPGWYLISIFYERNNVLGIIGSYPDHELYFYNTTSGEFEIAGSTRVLNEDESYWVYVTKRVNYTDPVTGLPTARTQGRDVLRSILGFIIGGN